jgi:cytochrome oxidase Cu insertion factor (SCO1/SenC/PrrC family)
VTSTNSNNSRRIFLLIAGIPVIIILAASWLWFYVASGKLDLVDMLGTFNRGTLLSPPVAVEDLQLVDASGQTYTEYTLEPALWRIVVPGRSGCDVQCRDVLHYTRQMHTAMGKYKNRIERVFLGLDMNGSEPLSAELAAQYPQMKLLYTATSIFEGGLGAGAGGLETPAYYVVDPNGWIMLAYAANADGKDLMADLKFLLKNSNG